MRENAMYATRDYRANAKQSMLLASINASSKANLTASRQWIGIQNRVVVILVIIFVV